MNEVRRFTQEQAAAGTDLAEIGFGKNGEPLVKEDEAVKITDQRVANLEEEVSTLRRELRQLKVKYQYGGVDPTTGPKPKWNWKTMLGLTPVEDTEIMKK